MSAPASGVTRFMLVGVGVRLIATVVVAYCLLCKGAFLVACAAGAPEPMMKEKNLLKFPVTIVGRAGKATRALVAGAAFAVAAGGFGVSAVYAAPVEGPAPAADAPAAGIDSVTGSTPGASTATGGLTIKSVKVTRPYDTVSAGTDLSVRIDYTGKNVQPGASFEMAIGEGLQFPPGLDGIKLKATALDGSVKEIGSAKMAGGKFVFTVDEGVNALGGNGTLNNAFVEYNVSVNKSAVGKTSTTITVDGTTYDISLGKGVIGEAFHEGYDKYLYSAGKTADGKYVEKGYVQATVAPGTALKAIEKGENATFGSAFYCTNTANWAETTKASANKLSADKREITAVAPADGDGNWTCRVSITQVGDSKKFTNVAVINEHEVSATATWRAKGDSGADTEADPEPEKPVTPTPEPTPTPDEPKPTPDKPVTPDTPKGEEPKPAPSATPTPEQPKPSTPAPAPSAPAAAGKLPKTGADMGVLGAAATALAGGVAALVAARRRRR